MLRYILASALFVCHASSVAAPMRVTDPTCVEPRFSDCMNNQYSPHYIPAHISGKETSCQLKAEAACTTLLDLPTMPELKALMEQSHRLQREQWAAWLKTLEDTGVVVPREQPRRDRQ